MFPYSTILQPLFWMSMGVLIALFFMGIKYWLADANIKMNGWKWSVLSGWFFFLALTVAAAFTLMGEGEWAAGKRFLLFFGIVLLLAGSGIWKLLKKA